ncbi:hypothetical protein QA600_09705 [Natronococcus sp. A-GB1]|nr:hypothetical protein [Natronococcus sp. A-GB1]MDG5759614.1 hypothetical protein [Natronococcus sp. A-GB1]
MTLIDGSREFEDVSLRDGFAGSPSKRSSEPFTDSLPDEGI